jgi:hypothetical protein
MRLDLSFVTVKISAVYFVSIKSSAVLHIQDFRDAPTSPVAYDRIFRVWLLRLPREM